VAVVGGAFLLAVRRAEARIHIEYDGSWRTPVVNGVDHILASGKPIGHRLPQHAEQIVATVAARAPDDEVLAGDGHQAERVIEFATGQLASVGGDAGTVEFQLEAAVEIELQGIGLRFTRWMRHLRPYLMRQVAEAYGSNGFEPGQFNGSAG